MSSRAPPASLLEQALDAQTNIIQPVPVRPATPSIAELAIALWSEVLCSTFKPRVKIENLDVCPCASRVQCTGCGASGDDVLLVEDRVSGNMVFICDKPTSSCRGWAFGRWGQNDNIFKSWPLLELTPSAPRRSSTPLNRVLELHILLMTDCYTTVYQTHNSDRFTMDDVPNNFVNNHLAFGSNKTLEIRRPMRPGQWQWFPMNVRGGHIIGKEKKLELRVVNSLSPTPFRFGADGDSDAGTATEPDSPPRPPARRKLLARPKKRTPAPASPVPTTSRRAIPGAPKRKRSIIDLSNVPDDTSPTPVAPKKARHEVIVIPSSDNEGTSSKVGEKRARTDKVVGKEKKVRFA